MRMTHTLSRVLGAAALALSLAGSLATTATAADDGRAPQPRFRMAAPMADPPPTALVVARTRRIHSNVVWRSGRLYLRGDVQSWSGRPVRIQRKECETCSWHRHETTRTGAKGWFRSRITAPRQGSTFWRAKVRAADGYSRSYSAVWETYF